LPITNASGRRVITLKGKQALFAQSKARYPAMFGGFASGKTTVGCLVGIDLCLRYPGIVGAVIRNTYPELRTSTKKVFMDLLHEMDRGRVPSQKIIESENEQYNIVKFTNGSMVFFLHTGSEALYKGPEFGWFLIDQAEELPEEIARKITTRLRQPGYPQKGMFVGNTDKGHNWCYRWFKLGQKPNSELFEISFVDNRDNLDKSFFDEMMSAPTDWKKVNLFGSWDSPGGLVLEPLPIHCIEAFPVPDRWPRLVGLDPADSTGTTAALAGTVDYHGNYYICNEYYHDKRLIRDHARGILMLWDSPPSHCVADPHSWAKHQAVDGQFLTLADRYREYGVAALPANDDMLTTIDILRELAEPEAGHRHPITGESPAPRLYFFYKKLPNLFEELRSWMIEEPDKEPCHATDALRYLIGSRIGTPKRRYRAYKQRRRGSYMGK